MKRKLYHELASWWPLLSPPEDYADEAEFFWRVISQIGLSSSASFLELGCGGGSNAFYLKHHFDQMTLTDMSPQMLAISQALNPDCEHLEGDMRRLRLGCLFDVVFIHDAIGYMTTLQDLQQAIETAFVHCKVGGVALFSPDYVCETFQPSTDHGGRDGEGRSLRYLEWTYDPDDADTTYVVEHAYLMRENNRPAQVEHEQHILGLFPRAEWLRRLSAVGFQAEILRDPYNRDIFVAHKGLA